MRRHLIIGDSPHPVRGGPAGAHRDGLVGANRQQRRAARSRRRRCTPARCRRRDDVLGYPLGCTRGDRLRDRDVPGRRRPGSDRVVTGTFAPLVAGPPAALRARRLAADARPAARRSAATSRRSATRRRPDAAAARLDRAHAGRPVDLRQRARQRAVRRRRRAANCSTTSPTAATASRSAILANSLVGLIPTQNPDGRANNLRTNATRST